MTDYDQQTLALMREEAEELAALALEEEEEAARLAALPTVCDACHEPYSDGVPCACSKVDAEADAIEHARAQQQLDQLEEIQ